MAYDLERVPRGWRVIAGGLTVEATSPRLDRGTVRATLSIYRDDAIIIRDAVNLTSERARARIVRRASEKGVTLDERVLVALDEGCRHRPPAPPYPPPAVVAPAELLDGAALLAAVETFVRRYSVLPCEDAYVAVTLWVAHAHALDAFESTPRLAFLSPEPACGKTRALEAIELLVPNPMLAVNATPAALFRAVADLALRPTILFDEIDTIFGPRAKENEALRGLLNAGHRRSGLAYRCVGEGTQQEVRAFPAYAAVALAGIGDLPDTLHTRSIVIKMRRRRPDEQVTPFRRREAEPSGHRLRDQLAAWAAAVAGHLRAVPAMPDGVVDRDADCWEPLLAVADAAGGDWPTRARAAAVALVGAKADREPSLGVRLLADIRAIFDQANTDVLATAALLERLCALDEAPWGNLRGRPLDARGLARRLGEYGIKSKNIRVVTATPKGYARADFYDAWVRYLPTETDGAPPAPDAPQAPQPPRPASASHNGVAEGDGPGESVRHMAGAPPHESRIGMRPVALVADVADFRRWAEPHENGAGGHGHDADTPTPCQGDCEGFLLTAESRARGLCASCWERAQA